MALSFEDTANRKPSRRDPFVDSLDPSKPYIWEEFTSATPAYNKDEKVVDLSKGRRLWYYLGKPSTESKAHYTSDLTKPFNDAASNFLQSVEPAKRPLIPQPRSVRRQSLPASYPAQHPIALSMPLANTAMAAPRRLSQAEQVERRTVDDYQRRMAVLGSPATSNLPAHYYTGYPAGVNRSPGINHHDQTTHLGDFSNQAAIQQDVLAKQKAILERSQQRAMVLDQQDRPYAYKPKSLTSSPNIGIDTQSVERQREFQRRAYQQSLANTQLSPHSPGMQSGFITNGQIPQLQQHAGPDGGTSYVIPQLSSNTAQYGQPSPSPTEAAFPLLRRPQQQLNTSQHGSQQDSFPFHSQAISSHQNSASVNYLHKQRRFSQPSHPHSPHFSHQSSLPSSPSINLINMPSQEKTAPIDIPQPRQSAAARVRNQGQHTSNFIDPNLMQLNSNHQTMSAANMSLTHDDKGKADQATRAMPPPPVPSPSSYPSYPSRATDLLVNYDQIEDVTNHAASGAKQAKDVGKKAVRFKSDLTKGLVKTDENMESPRTLINDKPVPQSIAMLPYSKNTDLSLPNAYKSLYDTSGRLVKSITSSILPTPPAPKEGTTVYPNGIKTKPVDDEDGWVDVKQLNAKEEAAEAEKGYVQVDHPGLGGKHRGSKSLGRRRSTPTTPTTAPGGFELAEDYYATRTAEQKKQIDPERDGFAARSTK